MGVFDDIAADVPEKIKDRGDVLGGGFGAWPSNLYDLIVEAAFFGKSQSGAHNVTLFVKDVITGKVFKPTIYITSKSKIVDGVQQGCKTTYTSRGETFRMPGYLLIEHLAMLTAGSTLVGLKESCEEKIVPIYNYEQKKDVNTPVQMIMPMVGKRVSAAIFCNKEDRNKKNDSTGEYEPTGKTREVNEIEKFMQHETLLTVTELQALATKAIYAPAWKKEWEGKTRDRTDKDWWAANPNGAADAASPAAAQATAPSDTIFEI